MSDLAEMQQLLKATAELLTAGGKAEKRKAIVKLERIAAIAHMLALTLKGHD